MAQNYNDFTERDPTVEYDEYGNPKKKPAVNALGTIGIANQTATPLPQQDPNNANGNVALSKAAMSGAAAAPSPTELGNTAILAKAQNDVLNQPSVSALQNATTQAATNWVQNPMGDFNPAQTKQARLEKANSDWANTFEAMRQQYGNVSGSGLLQKNMLQNALEHNVNQQDLEGKLDTENYNRYVDSLGRSIAAGQSVNQGNENVFSQRLGNLGTVRGMAEGEAGRQTSEEIAKAQIEATANLQKTSQAWQSGERIDQNSYNTSQAEITRLQQLAVQKNDIDAQKYLASERNKLDLAMQTQSMDHDTSMRYLDSMLADAKANNDVARQKDILSFTYTQDVEKMTAQFGFDTAKINLQGSIQNALQAGDFDHADAMQEALFAQQSKEHDKDIAEDRLKIELQKKGMDYDMMKSAVESGAATPEDLNNLIKASGIQIAPIDPQAGQKAIKQKLDDMKYEFLLTHPEFMHADLVDEVGLRNAFNEFVNKSTGTSSDVATKIGDVIQNPGNYMGSADPTNPKHADYVTLKNGASTFEPQFDKNGDLYQFKNAPAPNTAINYAGNLLVVSSPVQVEKTSWAPNNQYFMATDVNTGQQVKIYANQNPAAPYSGLSNIIFGQTNKLVDIAKTSGKAIAKWLGF